MDMPYFFQTLYISFIFIVHLVLNIVPCTTQITDRRLLTGFVLNRHHLFVLASRCSNLGEDIDS